MGKKYSLATSSLPAFQENNWQSKERMLNTAFPKDTKMNSPREVQILLVTIC